MKNKSNIVLESIKLNKEITHVFKTSKKICHDYLKIYFKKQKDLDKIRYAILVSKKNFKLAVTRNKVKRQIRAIIIQSDFKPGYIFLFKPNEKFITTKFQKIKSDLEQQINKIQNVK